MGCTPVEAYVAAPVVLGTVLGAAESLPEGKRKEFEPYFLAEIDHLEFAKSAYERGDLKASYRLLEDGLVSENEWVRSQFLEYLENHPEILEAAKSTFSVRSFKKTLSSHGGTAETIEARRLKIYARFAEEADYVWAKKNYERVFSDQAEE